MAFDFSEIFKKTEKKLNSLRKGKKDEYSFRTLNNEPALHGIKLDSPQFERVFDREFFAYGRCGLLIGKRGGSKSSLAFHLMVKIQDQGGFNVLVEPENALDIDYMISQGVDPSKVIIHHPNSVEESTSMILSYVDTLNDSDIPVGLFLDSLAANATDAEIEEEEMGKAMVGGRHAKLYAQFYRHLVSEISNTKLVFIGTNQQKDLINTTGGGGSFRPPEISIIGGDAQKFFSTHQLQVSRITDLTAKNDYGKEVKVGSRHNIVPIRNKLGREGTSMKVEMDLYINGGPDFYSPMIRSLGDDFETNPLIGAGTPGYYKCLIPGIKYLDEDDAGNTVEKEIPEGKPFRAKDMAKMFYTSEQGKAKCREIFGIKQAATKEEIAEVEAENKVILDKRKKRKKEVEESGDGL